MSVPGLRGSRLLLADAALWEACMSEAQPFWVVQSVEGKEFVKRFELSPTDRAVEWVPRVRDALRFDSHVRAKMAADLLGLFVGCVK